MYGYLYVRMCTHTYIYNVFSICMLFMEHLKKHFWEHFFPLVPKIHNTNTSVTKKFKGKKRESDRTPGEGPVPLCDRF